MCPFHLCSARSLRSNHVPHLRCGRLYLDITGPSFPYKTSTGNMLPTPYGTGVVLIGGGMDTANDLYELKCLSTICNWTKMEQTLTVGRSDAVAMYVPDSFADCHNAMDLLI
jgi:hypothetical protein